MATKLTAKQREENKQQSIRQNQQEKSIKLWTKQQGFNPQALTTDSIELLHAVKIAKNILLNMANYSAQTEDIVALQTFCKRSGYKHNKPTIKQCMAILNLAKKIKRKK